MNAHKPLLPLKRIFIFLFVLLSTLTIIACTPSNKVPYGSISHDTYLDIGGYSITERELYDQLRLNAASRLSSLINEKVFEEVLSDIDVEDLTLFQQNALGSSIRTAVFGSAISATDLVNLPSANRARRILTFADSFIITNPTVDADSLIDYIVDRLDNVIDHVSSDEFDQDEEFTYLFFDYDANPEIATTLFNQYKVTVAQRQYAKDILGDIDEDGNLTGELADEDSTVYISEEDIVTYYQNNISGRYDVSALIIPFENTREGELARFKHAIKPNARGVWYYIPNISNPDELAEVRSATDDDPNDPYYRAQQVLETSTSSALNNFDINDDRWDDGVPYNSPAYRAYYNEYRVASETDVSVDDSAQNNELLRIFLLIYDDLNGTSLAPATAAELAPGHPTREALEETLTYEYAHTIFTSNTALRSYVYGLDSDVLYDGGAGQDEDENFYGRPYSRQVTTYGSKPYLVYLLNDDRSDDDDILIYDEESETDIFNEENEAAMALRTESLEKLVIARLTSSYITSKANELREDVSVNIYDPVIRAFYELDYDYQGSTGFKNNDVLATANDIDITVDEFFAELESTLGLSTALDLILTQKLRDDYGDQISAEDRAGYREEFETDYVNRFLRNEYESAGFPSSMGLENFLLLAFQSYAHDGRSATQDAIDKVYVQPELRDLFNSDFEKHFPIEGADENDNIYARFAELAEKIYEEQVGITASHLLIYVDLNGDGSPDDPNDIDFEELGLVGINTLAEFEVKVQELVDVISERAKLDPLLTNGLNTIVTSYTDATRYPSYNPLDLYWENVWQQFKQLGLSLRYEDLGEITNQTNFPDSSSILDAAFFDYALSLSQHLALQLAESEEENGDSDISHLLPLYAPDLSDSEIEGANYSTSRIRSSFGWHLIIATDVASKPSAQVEPSSSNDWESEHLNPYTEENLSGLNPNDTLSWEQILIYLEESQEETQVVSLPSSVISGAVARYFTPVLTRYQNSYSQLEIAFRYIFDGNVVIEDEAFNTKLQNLRTANFNQFFSYAYFDGYDGTGTTIWDQAHNEQYAAVYGQWFDILGR